MRKGRLAIARGDRSTAALPMKSSRDTGWSDAATGVGGLRVAWLGRHGLSVGSHELRPLANAHLPYDAYQRCCASRYGLSVRQEFTKV